MSNAAARESIAKAGLSTDLLFLINTYRMRAEAKVSAAAKEGAYVDLVLDRTVFHPRGGGQPCDTGIIKLDSCILRVMNVTYLASGAVMHHCLPDSDYFPRTGEKCRLEIDAERRMLNARYHSAGHLIDLALQVSEFARPPLRASHKPFESWVQFGGGGFEHGTSVEDVRTRIQSIVEDIREEAPRIIRATVNFQTAARRGITIIGKAEPRVIYFEGYDFYARGCGGTHVRTTEEIGKVTVTHVRSRSGITTVNYRLGD